MFSGDRRFARSLAGFQGIVLAVLIEQGYRIRRRKTRIMRRGRRQTSLGLTLNDKINTPRRDYEAMKALLFNCVRHGPSSQNREGHAHFRSHLAGRIAFHASINARRGETLRRLFDRIEWKATSVDSAAS
jgi:RNA-directed DNA polymerase